MEWDGASERHADRCSAAAERPYSTWSRVPRWHANRRNRIRRGTARAVAIEAAEIDKFNFKNDIFLIFVFFTFLMPKVKFIDFLLKS